MRIDVKPTRTIWGGERWTLVITARNGEVVANGERYHNKDDAESTARAIAKAKMTVKVHG